MNYTRPEITVLTSAVNAIQGGSKGIDWPVDAPKDQTTSAYEADE